MPGMVFLPRISTGLPKDSLANVTAMLTVERRALDPRAVGAVPAHLMAEIDDGIRGVLGLG